MNYWIAIPVEGLKETTPWFRISNDLPEVWYCFYATIA